MSIKRQFANFTLALSAYFWLYLTQPLPLPPPAPSP